MIHVPTDRRYTREHQWVQLVADHLVRVGITERVQSEIDDAIVGFEIADKGEHLESEEVYGWIQSLVGRIQHLYAPLAGTVVELNDELVNDPANIAIFDDPYGEGWLMILSPDDFSEVESRLLDASEYQRLIWGKD
jgi:glycine cleavage system H protein